MFTGGIYLNLMLFASKDGWFFQGSFFFFLNVFFDSFSQ